jgi:hypothetical protein
MKNRYQLLLATVDLVYRPLFQDDISKEEDDANASLPPNPKIWVFTPGQVVWGGGMDLDISFKREAGTQGPSTLWSPLMAKGFPNQEPPTSDHPMDHQKRFLLCMCVTPNS